MKYIINNAFQFIRKNPAIIYSLILIVVITALLFGNTYYALNNFQGVTDQLLQSKGLLAGNISRIVVSAEAGDEAQLASVSEKFKSISEQDSEVRSVVFFKPTEEDGTYMIAASNKPEDAGTKSSDAVMSLIWNGQKPLAYLGSDERGRFWNIGELVKDGNGKKIGILFFQMSLDAHDRFVQAAISRVYVVTLLSLLVVLLLVANHIRTLKYAIKATKLEEIDHMKDDFISMASHELKSPLTAMQGYVELLSDDLKEKSITDCKKEEVAHYVEQIGSSTRRLRELVEDLLEVSRLQQNRVPVNMSEISVKEIVFSAVEQQRVLAKEKGLELKLSFVELPMVFADPERVRQIVINLISNAIKYTPKGTVELMSKEDEEFFYLIVADSGLGMSAEQSAHLFEKFYRVKTEQTNKISGTGLGLWISLELARKMGGDITVESIEGVGSHFTLKLRKAKKS